MAQLGLASLQGSEHIYDDFRNRKLAQGGGRLRITFVQGDYSRSPRGGPRVVYQYANGLAARGHEVTVVHPRKLPIRPPTLFLRIRRKLGEKRDLIYAPKMKWQHLHEKVRMLYVSDLSPENIPDGDAVFATAWHTAPCVLGYPKQKGEKFYLIQGYETWAGPKEAVDATWLSKLHKIVVARWLSDLGTQLGCTDITHIPNGIEHDLFRLSVPLDARSPRVIYMYSADISKGADYALEALERAKKQNPRLEVAYFGTGPRPRSIPGWIEYYRDPERAELAEKIYSRGSIFLSSSWSEGLPLSPAEAMACGCALVATDIPGIREYAEDGVTALLSPIKNSQAMAINILRLLENDELRIRLATTGCQRIQEFTWGRSTNLLEEFVINHLGSGKEKAQQSLTQTGGLT